MAAFDPDAYLAKSATKGFDPDAYLADGEHDVSEWDDTKKPMSALGPKGPVRATPSAEQRDATLKGMEAAPGAIGEAALSAGTGLASSVVGGFAGAGRAMWGMAQGEGFDAAMAKGADVVKDTTQAGTYQPRSEGGKNLTQAAAAPFEMASEGWKGIGGGVGEALGNRNAGEAIGGAVMPVVGALAMKTPAGKAGVVLSAEEKVAAAAEKAKAAPMNSQEAFPKGAPPIDPEMAVVAQKGIDKGYKILPHKLMEPGVLKSMGETAEEVPFGGVYDHNKKTFNTDVANQIGADAGVTKVTPGVLKKALNTHGDVIGERMSEVTLPLKDIETTLTKTTESLRELEPTVGAPVKGFIDRLREHAAENNGVIPGNVLQQYIADLGKRARRTSDMNLRGELTDLRETLLDAALEKITDPTKKAQLLDARMKYAKGMTIEPMVAKLKLGGILPEDLIGALKKNNGNHRLATQAAGELGETATIAENFITIKPESTVKTRGWLREAAGDIASGVGAVTVGPLYKKFGPGIAERKIAANQPPPPPAAPPPVAPKPLALGYTPEGIPIPEQQQNWQYGMNGDPVPPTFGAEVPPSGAPRLPAPSAAPVKDFKYRQKEAAAAAEDAKIKSTEESAPRKSTSGEVPLDLDPVTGKLKPVSAGVKGATPEVWQADTGANLKSASEKVAAGKRFDMTAAEKVAWDKTVVDLAEVGPEFKALSPKAVAEKMRDRDWVQSAVDKAREKAKGFDAIMERATAKAREQDILFKNHEASVAAEKANEASRAARTRLMDLVEQLESSLSKPRPVKGTGQGPKTRAARKAEAGMARKIAGYKMDGSPFYEGGEDVIITGTGK